MLIVETIAKVRRAYFSDGKSIKAICRELRLSRKVVRKLIRSGETSFSYERAVQPRPKLGQWTATLDELLEANTAKPAREQLTLIRLFEDLRGRGYEGGYDAVRRYARRWSKERGESTAAAYVPLSFAPGEAFQFDSHGDLLVKSFRRSRRSSFGNLVRLERLVLIVRAFSGLVRVSTIRCWWREWRARDGGQGCKASAKPECAKRMSLTRVSSSRRKYCRQRTAVATSRLDKARTLAASRSMI